VCTKLIKGNLMSIPQGVREGLVVVGIFPAVLSLVLVLSPLVHPTYLEYWGAAGGAIMAPIVFYLMEA